MQQQLAELTAKMQMHAGPVKAGLHALSLTQKGFNNQAQLWAYVDDFRYLALLCAACIPLAFLLKRPQSGTKGAA